ncbi:MAG: hypothetical protein P8M78_09915 [Myxococcota bacterium]|nr:hypothetical protein [Myxococcota bacterium]
MRTIRIGHSNRLPTQLECPILTNYNDLSGRKPSEHFCYDEAKYFAAYSTVWGSNVSEQDAFNRRFCFLPIPVRQLVGLLTGTLPTFYVLSHSQSKPVSQARHRKITVLAASTGIGLANLITVIAFSRSQIQKN